MSSEALDPVSHDMFTTVDNYDPKVMARAYDMFLKSSMDFTDIAIALGLNRKVVASWARRGAWVERKRQIDEELMRAADIRYRSWAAENKLPEAKLQLDTAKTIELAIKGAIDRLMSENKEGHVSDMTLKRLAEALSAASNVSARAVGLNEAPLERKADSELLQPLIVLNVQPSAPPGQERDAVDVECREVDDECGAAGSET